MLTQTQSQPQTNQSDPIMISFPGEIISYDHDAKMYMIKVNVKDFPLNSPLHGNPRHQSTKCEVFEDMTKTLLNEDGGTPNNFYKKNNGTHFIVEDISSTSDLTITGEVVQIELLIDPSKIQGLINGAHTMRAIQAILDQLEIKNQGIIERIAEGSDETPISQYVKVFVYTECTDAEALEIVIATNKSNALDEMSLANLDGDFEWMKKLVHDNGWDHLVCYKQNAQSYDENAVLRGPGEKIHVRADYILKYITQLNKEVYPHKPASNRVHLHPWNTYNSHSSVLNTYRTNPNRKATYIPMESIFKDIMILMDRLQISICTSKTLLKNKDAIKYGFLKPVSSGVQYYPFLNRTITPEDNEKGSDCKKLYRVEWGVWAPIFAGFRALLDDNYKWVGDDFEEAWNIWENAKDELLGNLFAIFKAENYHVNHFAGSTAPWTRVYDRLIIGKEDFEKREYKKLLAGKDEEIKKLKAQLAAQQ